MLAVAQAETGKCKQFYRICKMGKIITRDSLILLTESIIFRIIIFILGLALCSFYGVLMIGAIVNLPVSWFGFLYSLGGIISGVLCFIYFFKKTKVLLAIIAPAVIMMIITLINTGSEKATG